MMVQPVKCFPQECEDLSVNPDTQVKKGLGGESHNTRLGKRDKVEVLELSIC